MPCIKATHNGVERRTPAIKDDLWECGCDDANLIHMPETGSGGQVLYCPDKHPGRKDYSSTVPNV